MSMAVGVSPAARQSLHLNGVDWRTYSRLLRALGDRPGLRVAYDRGDLEMMSPGLELDDDARFLGDMVFVLTEELRLPLKRGGSTTLRRRLRRRGIEADECFWIANAHRLAGRRRLDLRTDPPPDLAIEVDVSQSSLDRLGIYAALQVPEVWRLEGDSLTFFVLGPNKSYAQAAESCSFSQVTPSDLMVFIQQAREAGDQNDVIREFRNWIRRRVAQ
jgi:Uma2 family endonuclease